MRSMKSWQTYTEKFMAAISETDVHDAERRMQQRLAEGPRAIAAHYDRRVSRVIIMLSSGVELAFPPRLAEGLSNARPDDLDEIELSPTGLGLHFPKLDADLYVPALLNGIMGSQAWVAKQLGAKGGASTSVAKSAVSRANGKKGGRPRIPIASASPLGIAAKPKTDKKTPSRVRVATPKKAL